MYDNSFFLGLRSVARRTGVNKIVGTLIGLFGYEHAFGARILAQIKPGDCVWDVGANVGLYSEQFAERAGNGGKVVGFEPSQDCCAALITRMAATPTFVAVNAALGATDGSATLFCAADSLAATHTLSADAGRTQSHAGTKYVVPVFSGDSWAAQHPESTPNVIKIDVEGFESDVIDGMNSLLDSPVLRALFIEVHFTLLQAQGKQDAPHTIVQKLRRAGFAITWPDPSHIAAVRSGA